MPDASVNSDNVLHGADLDVEPIGPTMAECVNQAKRESNLIEIPPVLIDGLHLGRWLLAMGFQRGCRDWSEHTRFKRVLDLLAPTLDQSRRDELIKQVDDYLDL